MSTISIDNGFLPEKEPVSTKNRKLDARIQALQEKLRKLEQRQALKQLKKHPVFSHMLKTRRALIKAVEIFEQDKEQVPLEVLSLSKRLIFAINEAEENLPTGDETEPGAEAT